MPLWLLKGTPYADTFRVAMGRVGDNGGLQEGASSLGMWRVWPNNQGVGKGHCGSG